MPVSYRPAPIVKEIAEKLILDYHQDLEDVRIEYVFRSEAAKQHGAEIWGKARKVSGLNAYLASNPNEQFHPEDELDFFVIEIAEDIWSEKLDEAQRIALVDHELMHLLVDIDEKTEEPILKLRAHDLEEFRSIVERHGLWRPDLTLMANSIAGAVQQQFDGIDK